MADNVILNTSDLAGATVATDELADSSHVQLQRIVHVESGEDTIKEVVFKTDDDLASFPAYGGTLMMVRDDAIGTLTPVEGDWNHALCSAEGALWVQELNSDAILADTGSLDSKTPSLGQAAMAASMPVTIASNQTAIPISGGGTPYTEDAVVPTPTVGTAIMAERDDTSYLTPLGSSPDDGDWTHLRTNEYGSLWTTLDGNGFLPDTAVSNFASMDADLTSLATAVETIGGTVAAGFVVGGEDGSGDFRPISVDTDGVIDINISGSLYAATDDSVYTPAGKGAQVSFIATATTDSVDINDVGTLKMTTSRELAVSIQDSTATVTVDGTVGLSGNLPDTSAFDLSGINSNTSSTASNTSSTASNTSSIASDTSTIASSTTSIDSYCSNIDMSSSGTNSNTSQISTNTTNIPNVIGTDGALAPSHVLAVGGVDDGTGELEVLDVSSLGYASVLVQNTTLQTASTYAYDDDDSGLDLHCFLQGYEDPANTVSRVSLAQPLPVQPGTSVTWEVVGDAADDAAASGNPVLIGGKYRSTLDAVDADDVGTIAISEYRELLSIPQTKYVQYGNERCEVKDFMIVTNTSGTQVLIIAVATKKFRILGMQVFSTTTTDTGIYFLNDDHSCLGSSSGKIYVSKDADGDNSAGFIMPFSEYGYFSTDTVNEAFAVNQSAGNYNIYLGQYIEHS